MTVAMLARRAGRGRGWECADLARQPVPATATVAPLGPPGLGARPAAGSPVLFS